MINFSKNSFTVAERSLLFVSTTVLIFGRDDLEERLIASVNDMCKTFPEWGGAVLSDEEKTIAMNLALNAAAGEKVYEKNQSLDSISAALLRASNNARNGFIYPPRPMQNNKKENNSTSIFGMIKNFFT